MTKTRVPRDEKSVTQKETGMENNPVTSVSKIPVSSNNVKLENSTDIAEVTVANAEQSAIDPSQPHINTFPSLGKLYSV